MENYMCFCVHLRHNLLNTYRSERRFKQSCREEEAYILLQIYAFYKSYGFWDKQTKASKRAKIVNYAFNNSETLFGVIWVHPEAGIHIQPLYSQRTWNTEVTAHECFWFNLVSVRKCRKPHFWLSSKCNKIQKDVLL